MNSYLVQYKSNIDVLTEMEEWDYNSNTFPLLDIGDNGYPNTTSNYTFATALNKYLTKCTEIVGTKYEDLVSKNCSSQLNESMIRAEQFIVTNSKSNYRLSINTNIKDMLSLENKKIASSKSIIFNMLFICPLCELIIILIIIPSLVIVYRIATTILYQLCEIPMQYCKTLIEQANKFRDEMQLPMLKLAKIFTSIDFLMDRDAQLSNQPTSNKEIKIPSPMQSPKSEEKKEDEADALMQTKVEDEADSRRKIDEKRKLFQKYNGRKARIFLLKVILLLVPIFIYAAVDYIMIDKYFGTITLILSLFDTIYNMDIYPVGGLFLLRENILLNTTLYDGNSDVVDLYLNKSFSILQTILELRKDMDELSNFREYLDMMNTNGSCTEIVNRLSMYDINITLDTCLNVSHSAVSFGYNNAMMYFLRILQDIKFRMDFSSKTAEFLKSMYYSSDLIEGLDLYMHYIKMASIQIFFKLYDERQVYFDKTLRYETIKLVIQLAIFLLVFLSIWINIINSLQHDVNTTKGVLNIFPTKYILPQKSFLIKIKSSFVFK